MRFLISSVGSSGDLNPYLGIGQALARRGHSVAFITQPYFESAVVDAGLEFIPAGERFDLSALATRPEMMGPRLGSVRILREYMIPQSGPAAAAALATIDRARPDVVFAHHMSWGALWAAEKREIPTAVGCLSPLIFVSREDTCVPTSSGRIAGRGMLGWLERRITRWMCRALYDPPINRMRRGLGLPRLSEHFIRTPRRSALTLGLWSPHFRAPMGDDPPNAAIIGFVWFDRHREQEHAPAEIERFLDEGDPPIIFTLGTTAVHVAGPFYAAAAEACRRLGRRGLLLTGRPEYAPPSLPAGVRAFTYAPFSTVLPRGCATVHHGGIGTTAQAMRAGRPTVIVPFAHDQFDNAARAERLGVSATIRRFDLSAETLTPALRSLLENPMTVRKAALLGGLLAAEDGAEAAADRLEHCRGP